MTPQEKTKEELPAERSRSDENRFQRLFDSMMDAFCEVDMSGRLINFNSSFEKLLGYTPDELRKLTYSDITPPKWHGFEAEIVEKEILPQGYSQIYEKEYRRKDGSVFPIELRSFLIKNDAGKPVSIWAIIRDISERKRTRDALRENEEKYRQLFNLANDAIFLMNKEVLIDCNSKALEIFGCTRAQIIGQPPERFFPPVQSDGRPSLEKAREKINAALQGYPQFFEWLHARYDGAPFPTEVSLNSIMIRGEQHIQGLIRDISRRKEMEDSLRASEERFKAIFDNANDGILIADAQTQQFILGNNKLSQMLGYEPKEIRGLRVKDIHPPESLPAVIRDFEKQSRGEILISENTPVLRKDGRLIFVDISAASTVLSGKTYMIGIFRDNTERRNAEEELAEAYQKLKETHAQLVQSTKMASVGILAGGVAHEINNPLTGILNNVQLIAIMAHEKQDFNLDDFKSILKDVEVSALRCVHITQSLLNFSHTSKGVFEPISLNNAVNDIIPLVEKELKLQNIVLRIELKSDLPFMRGDSQLVEQVIFDMVNNARWAIVKRNDGREGVITVKTDLEPDKKNVSVAISDTGIGIPREHVEKIFDPFFTTKEPGEGTGLGLAIAYNIVKSHQGSIEVKSEKGVGTTFKLLFHAL